jgi:Meiotically up-regulated gene 113
MGMSLLKKIELLGKQIVLVEGEEIALPNSIMRDLRVYRLLDRGKHPSISKPLHELPVYIKNSILEAIRAQVPNAESLTAEQKEKAKRIERNFGHAEKNENVSGAGVYILRSANGLCKIGCTGDLAGRLVAFWQMVPEDLELFAFLPCSYHKITEFRIHQTYKDKREKGEWFLLTVDDLARITQTFGFLLVNRSISDFLQVSTAKD